MTDREHLPLNRHFTNALGVGGTYRVRLTIDRGRGPLVYDMTAVYLGWVSRGNSPEDLNRVTTWSLRPIAGTQELPEEDIIQIWAADGDSVHPPKRRLRAGSRRDHRPTSDGLPREDE